MRTIRGGTGRTRTAGHPLPTTKDIEWAQWWDRNGDDFLWPERRQPAFTAGTTRPVDRDDRASRGVVYTRVVPKLLRVLDGADDAGDAAATQAALLALGRAVDEDLGGLAVEAAIEHLDHADVEVQIGATLCLGLIASEEAPPVLLELLRCSTKGHKLVGGGAVPDRVKAMSALALGLTNDPATVPSLIDFVERTPDSEWDLKACAVAGMGLMDGEAAAQAADYLRIKLFDRRLDPSIRSAIPTTLARMGRTDAVDDLLELLDGRNTDRLVQQSAAIALGRLGRLGDERIVDSLVRAVVESRDAPTRHFALIGLARLGAAAEADVDQTSAESHDRLVKLLQRQTTRPRRSIDRPWAALAAGIYGRARSDARPMLVDRLRDAFEDVKDPSVRGAFALGLGLMGDRESGDALLAAFRETRDDGFRSFAALGLGLLGHGEANEDLRAAAEDKTTSASLRRAVAHALHLNDDREAVAALESSFADASTLVSRTSMAEALGTLRRPESIATLLDAAGDEDLDTASRASACWALGRVAEKTRQPWVARLGVDSNFIADRGTLDTVLSMQWSIRSYGD